MHITHISLVFKILYQKSIKTCKHTAKPKNPAPEMFVFFVMSN